jgi:hypothetical protein
MDIQAQYFPRGIAKDLGVSWRAIQPTPKLHARVTRLCPMRLDPDVEFR